MGLLVEVQLQRLDALERLAEVVGEAGAPGAKERAQALLQQAQDVAASLMPR